MQLCQPEARLARLLQTAPGPSGPFIVQVIYEAAGRLHTTPLLSPILARLHRPDAASNGNAPTFCILVKHDSSAARHHAV